MWSDETKKKTRFCFLYRLTTTHTENAAPHWRSRWRFNICFGRWTREMVVTREGRQWRWRRRRSENQDAARILIFTMKPFANVRRRHNDLTPHFSKPIQSDGSAMSSLAWIMPSWRISISTSVANSVLWHLPHNSIIQDASCLWQGAHSCHLLFLLIQLVLIFETKELNVLLRYRWISAVHVHNIMSIHFAPNNRIGFLMRHSSRGYHGGLILDTLPSIVRIW